MNNFDINVIYRSMDVDFLLDIYINFYARRHGVVTAF